MNCRRPINPSSSYPSLFDIDQYTAHERRIAIGALAVNALDRGNRRLMFVSQVVDAGLHVHVVGKTAAAAKGVTRTIADQQGTGRDLFEQTASDRDGAAFVLLVV